MRAVTISQFGAPEVLTIAEILDPSPGPQHLLVRVRAFGLNRADALQRAGNYPPPPGENDIPGLELAGEVISCGAAVTGFAPGDRVFGLVGSGAYAERALIDHRLAVTVPEGWDYEQAAAVIEVFCTAEETLFGRGHLQSGESILVHAGASGVGTTAVQMARHAGATVYFTASSDAKIDTVMALGADAGVNYKTHDFVNEIKSLTAGEGVDVIEDFIGADYMKRNIASLKPDGCLVLVGLMGGRGCEFDLAPMLRRRLCVCGFNLRAQPVELKQAIVGRFKERWLPLLVEGTVRIITYAVYPFADTAEAHRVMEANENIGKLIIAVE